MEMNVRNVNKVKVVKEIMKDEQINEENFPYRFSIICKWQCES